MCTHMQPHLETQSTLGTRRHSEQHAWLLVVLAGVQPGLAGGVLPSSCGRGGQALPHRPDTLCATHQLCSQLLGRDEHLRKQSVLPLPGVTLRPDVYGEKGLDISYNISDNRTWVGLALALHNFLAGKVANAAGFLSSKDMSQRVGPSSAADTGAGHPQVHLPGRLLASIPGGQRELHLREVLLPGGLLGPEPHQVLLQVHGGHAAELLGPGRSQLWLCGRKAVFYHQNEPGKFRGLQTRSGARLLGGRLVFALTRVPRAGGGVLLGRLSTLPDLQSARTCCCWRESYSHRGNPPVDMALRGVLQHLDAEQQSLGFGGQGSKRAQ